MINQNAECRNSLFSPSVKATTCHLLVATRPYELVFVQAQKATLYGWLLLFAK
jgi:hypothetical protein